ncbi:pyridine nucleotide-disulfide oxidoreductase [Bacillus canaveralius]|uniref:Pyridine nucleotide-disulfide oxidoreductase n=2 Tax=Bacillus canaveralius TaxID=1403243 RepID=A0A2N5GH82_9BACI|nr:MULTISPECIES: NAD(P)/FAD-dependent oxidoreductase [Bacillus]PLR80128.1 pyridine nucleotide-disulfide oxidoreductase [Bacillus canaveralius]PLR84720.1 pyridine nucleotide-disulfide oxidoreductase [Bacillus sp. V33-4]PLR91652.1 pyridine nucleotide-disulfide oxidoreductase [Bacillus canaveralius]RSK57581.1 NAD(P)/FAD-dependent oxidoreductase [Bacillus canaveralius]
MYDCMIIGGGIAGLQAAIQLGRYKHKVLVIDANDGRSSICKGYHNVLGYPDGISGEELRKIGRKQAEQYGVEFFAGKADQAKAINEGEFNIMTDTGESFTGKRLLLATGVMDRIPNFPEIYPCLGMTVYVCPDCDGYEVKDQETIVLGSGNPGANMALTLLYWTNKLTFINHEQKPVDDKLQQKLKDHSIRYIDEPIQNIVVDGENFKGAILKNGEKLPGSRGFIAFGGNEVKSGLAQQLGVQTLENRHIPIDPRTKMTNVQNVWAAGDVAAHSEQVTIAMGDGSQSAIWIHKSLM